MFETFDKYYKKAKTDNNYSDVLLAGQNIFAKNPGNFDFFSKYVEMLFDYYNSCKDKNVINYISNALSVFSENVEINDASISFIRQCESKIKYYYSSIEKNEEKEKREYLKTLITSNDKIIEKIKTLISDLEFERNEETYLSILNEITKEDEMLNVDNFVERQKKDYDGLTKRLSKIIEEKNKDFERQKNVQYNSDAINTYERLFKAFCNKNIEYNEGQIVDLFAFDTTRLFNETIVYYNYVYSFIFNRLDDESKVKMTRLAILTEKKR